MTLPAWDILWFCDSELSSWVNSASKMLLQVCNTWEILSWFETTVICMKIIAGSSEPCVEMRWVKEEKQQCSSFMAR